VDVTAERFPDTLTQGGSDLTLSYHFEPGHPADGVTLTVPLHAFNTLDFHRLEWLVPGLIREKMETLVKGLPKRLRRNLVPVPDFVQAALEAMPWAEGNLYARLGRELSRMSGMTVSEEDLRGVALPDHLHMNLRVVDEDGNVLAEGRDPDTLQAEWGTEASRAFGRRAGSDWYRDDITHWDIGELPEQVELAAGMAAWPALEEQSPGACLRLFETPEEADAAHRRGLRALLMTVLADKRRYLERNPPVTDRACLQYAPVDTCQALREDFLVALFDRVVADAGEIRDGQAFQHLVSETAGSLLAEAQAFGGRVEAIVEGHARVSRGLDGEVARLWPRAAGDMADQLAWLVWPGFLCDVPAEALAHYPRYLEAMERRLTALKEDPEADERKMVQVEPYWHAYQDAVAVWGWPGPPELERIRWMVEEFRVSLFAQPLGTARPVSPKRLDRALGELAALE
jgi:ATP-dependent helicase HrpA